MGKRKRNGSDWKKMVATLLLIILIATLEGLGYLGNYQAGIIDRAESAGIWLWYMAMAALIATAVSTIEIYLGR